MNKLISQGAEAKIFLVKTSTKDQVTADSQTKRTSFANQGGEEFSEKIRGRKSEDLTIAKDRISKSYRHPKLDNQLRRRRTKSEAKILTKAAAAGASVPKVLSDLGIGRIIHMEFIKGDRLSETLNDYEEKKQFQVMNEIGRQVAILHENNIIHGDLTTSNTILKSPAGESSPSQNKRSKASPNVFIIDFGLGFISTKIEDKAVDLHLIKQALEAKHFQNHQDLFKNFCEGYLWSDSKKILERLEVVEKRGRYKH